jgi:streptogramin lyase
MTPPEDALERTYRRVRRRARNRRIAAGAVGLASTAAVWTIVGLLSRVLGPGTPAVQAGEGVAVIRGSVVDAAVDGSLWVLTCEASCGSVRHSRGAVVRIDLPAGTPSASIPVETPHAIAVGEGGAWAVSFWDGVLTRIDPASNDVVATVDLTLPFEVAPGDRRFLAWDVTAGEGAVWVSTVRGVVARIDPATDGITATIPVPGGTTRGLAAGAGAVWVAEDVLGVFRIDPATNAVVAEIPVQDGRRRLAVSDVVVSDGRVWAAGTWAVPTVDEAGHEDFVGTDDEAVVQIDPATDRVVGAIAAPTGASLMVGDSAVWFTDRQGTEAFRIDPATSRVVASITAPPGARFIAAQGGALWAVYGDGALERVEVGP